MMSYATEFWHFLTIGLFVGLAGGSFSVGTPYVARWFPKNKQGTAMGIYGAGNSGSAVNKFVAPVILVAFGWTMVPQVYAAIMLGTLVLFWFFSYSDPKHLVPNTVSFGEQMKALKDPKVIKYCQYYSIVFGGYVALALWMVQYYVGEFGLDIRVAALLAACFSLPGGVLRAFGGILSDKFGAHSVTWWVMWVSWICLFLLSYPQTDFTITTVNGPVTYHIGLNVYMFTALMFILGIAMAFGKASVFKYISDDYSHNIGAISGIVGLAGGLGGFVLPIMFGALMDLTGIRSSAFMLMYGVVCPHLDVLDRSSQSRADGQQRQELFTSKLSGITMSNNLSEARDIAQWNPEDESSGKTRARGLPTVTCGSRCPRCCAALRSGACGIITVQMLNLGFRSRPLSCLR